MSEHALVGKTISSITKTLERTMFNADYARLPGLLQGIDPRAKLVSTFLFLLAVGFIRHLGLILAIYALALLLGRLSRLPLTILSKGVWLGMPLFAMIIALPAVFTMPGDELLAVGSLGQWRIAVSDNGLHSAALLVARVGTSISLALLLVLTTRWADLLKALRVLHVPDTFIVVFGMTYRYLFLLLHAINGLFLARASRTVGNLGGGAQRRWVATTTGALLSRSFRMSEDVYQAMVSRGYGGEIRTMASFRMADHDWLMVGLAVVFAAGALLIDRGIG